MDRLQEIDELLLEARQIDSMAEGVQGDRELSVGRERIDQLVDAYNRWYARALAVLPEEQHTEFEDLYEGGNFIKRIKSFPPHRMRSARPCDRKPVDLLLAPSL